MISFLRGTLASKTQEGAHIEVNGIGYLVGMSQSSLAKLPETGEPVYIHTYLQVREDSLSLFGFLSLDEKELFLRLIGVSGVGPKVALAAISSFTPAALVNAIVTQDVSLVSRIPGVGKKTASRIILELKDVLGSNLPSFSDNKLVSPSLSTSQAVDALMSMGFTSQEVDLALQEAPEGGSESVLIQYALKRLGEGVASIG